MLLISRREGKTFPWKSKTYEIKFLLLWLQPSHSEGLISTSCFLSKIPVCVMFALTNKWWTRKSTCYISTRLQIGRIFMCHEDRNKIGLYKPMMLQKQGETPCWWSVVNKESAIWRSKNKNRLQGRSDSFHLHKAAILNPVFSEKCGERHRNDWWKNTGITTINSLWVTTW